MQRTKVHTKWLANSIKVNCRFTTIISLSLHFTCVCHYAMLAYRVLEVLESDCLPYFGMAFCFKVEARTPLIYIFYFS